MTMTDASAVLGPASVVSGSSSEGVDDNRGSFNGDLGFFLGSDKEGYLMLLLDELSFDLEVVTSFSSSWAVSLRFSELVKTESVELLYNKQTKEGEKWTLKDSLIKVSLYSSTLTLMN